MILINHTPPHGDAELTPLYARMPVEGLVHSSLMHREHYEQSASFVEDWSCPSITWSTAGEESYSFLNGRRIRLQSAGALTLAVGERYSYNAFADAPFRSNMIVFPHWITKAADKNLLEENAANSAHLTTRLFIPDLNVLVLMDAIAGQCRRGATRSEWFSENAALLYDLLLDAQDRRSAARDQIAAVKASTRAELARRAGAAKQAMLQRYSETGLSLNEIAREACLSPYHLIRVFKTLSGATPMQFLAIIRMDAALRLLQETAMSMSEIANTVGYSDRTAFFKAFRKHYGHAPSAVERPSA